MKQDIVGTFMEIGLFCVTCILFVIIIIVSSLHTNETVVKDLATEFVDLCRTTGCVNPQEYQAFVSQLSIAGDYTVEIIHEPKQYYIADVNGNKSMAVDYYFHGTEDIMNVMFTEVGEDVPYEMKNGDRFSVKIRRGEGNQMVTLTKLLLRYDISNYIIVYYGGQVGFSG